MKIAVYKDSLSTGRGADRAVRNFAAGLAERGHAVALMEKDEFLSQMEASYQHKFAKKPEVIEGNMQALRRAFEEVQ